MTQHKSTGAKRADLATQRATRDAKEKKARFAPGTLAIATANSQNKKIGKAATTYVAQVSCPEPCLFFDGGGCYAEQGQLGMFTTKPLNEAAQASETPATPEAAAAGEAAAIDKMRVVRERPLRLHTLGDCKTDEAAQTVAAAAARYVERGGGPVWTYTHGWREVARESWGGVHVLASCETAEDVAAAQARGYATAIVVEEYKARGLYHEDGVNVVPCPAQTKPGTTCVQCRLCMNSERLRSQQLTIGFEVHGTPLGIKHAKLALSDPVNPDRKLTSRVRIPRFISSFISEHGREPKNTEIADALGITTSSVSAMRRNLAREGNVPEPSRPTRKKAR